LLPRGAKLGPCSAELFNYVGALRSLSQGRASFTMAFSRYAPLPKALLEKVL
jgi:elongation factor G